MSYELLLESKIEKITNDIQLDKLNIRLNNNNKIIDKHEKIYETMINECSILNDDLKKDENNQNRNISFKFIRNVKTIFRSHLQEILDTFEYDGNFKITLNKNFENNELVDKLRHDIILYTIFGNDESLCLTYNNDNAENWMYVSMGELYTQDGCLKHLINHINNYNDLLLETKKHSNMDINGFIKKIIVDVKSSNSCLQINNIYTKVFLMIYIYFDEKYNFNLFSKDILIKSINEIKKNNICHLQESKNKLSMLLEKKDCELVFLQNIKKEKESDISKIEFLTEQSKILSIKILNNEKIYERDILKKELENYRQKNSYYISPNLF